MFLFVISAAGELEHSMLPNLAVGAELFWANHRPQMADVAETPLILALRSG